VKNLKSHDKGKTFTTICDALEEVGYTFETRIIDAAHWVPQHRERIYFIGFRNDLNVTKEQINELFPEPPENRITDLDDIVMPEVEIHALYGDKYTLGQGTWDALKRHKAHHQEKGNGFGFNMISQPFGGKVTRTMSARYHKDGAEILLEQEGVIPRRITPLEACKLQGFPEECYRFFNGEVEQPVSNSQIYKQFGNSVAVPVLNDIAENITNFVVERQLLQNRNNVILNEI
jgi:DNA (cytosine-5)-methyltransferase 1